MGEFKGLETFRNSERRSFFGGPPTLFEVEDVVAGGGGGGWTFEDEDELLFVSLSFSLFAGPPPFDLPSRTNSFGECICPKPSRPPEPTDDNLGEFNGDGLT